MKIATWNVNSIRIRVEAAVAWLKEANPDVVCLQELKCQDDQFPKEPFEALGYNCAVHGQKTYNGVAILSRRPLEDVTPRLPGDDGDDHARYMEAVVPGDKGTVRIASIYLPNGNPIGTEKFTYKLAWLERLAKRAKALLEDEEPVALMGDFNVIPQPEDCYDPKAWMKDALFQPESRAALRKIEYLGYTDAFRACDAQPNQYTFWDYQAGAWQKDHGIRIDHILLSPQAADRLKRCAIDKQVRGRDKPSDHVPIWCELENLSMPIEGGCHCRAIRYHIDGPFGWASYCHCRMCQLTMGSPAGVYVNVEPEHFHYTAGEPKIYLSSEKAQREFCGTCGAQVVFRRTNKPRMSVNIVTLDDPSAVEPTLHIWTESRIPWFDTADKHPRRKQTQP